MCIQIHRLHLVGGMARRAIGREIAPSHQVGGELQPINAGAGHRIGDPAIRTAEIDF